MPPLAELRACCGLWGRLQGREAQEQWDWRPRVRGGGSASLEGDGVSETPWTLGVRAWVSGVQASGAPGTRVSLSEPGGQEAGTRQVAPASGRGPGSGSRGLGAQEGRATRETPSAPL